MHARSAQVPRGRDEQAAVDVGAALARHDRLAILGGPGTGKTTLLAYLTLTYARRQAQARLGLKERRLPIHVPLRQLERVLAGDGQGSLPAYLAAWSPSTRTTATSSPRARRAPRARFHRRRDPALCRQLVPGRRIGACFALQLDV